MDIFCYTDGSACVSGKHAGCAGWSTFFPNIGGRKRAFSGGTKAGKTGGMEVTALLKALQIASKNLDPNDTLIIYSDSQYVTKSFTEGRLLKWASNGWRNSSGEVKNLELWKQIYDIAMRGNFGLELRHIKSHQLEKCSASQYEVLRKDPHILGNLVVDKLADYKRYI